MFADWMFDSTVLKMGRIYIYDLGIRGLEQDNNRCFSNEFCTFIWEMRLHDRYFIFNMDGIVWVGNCSNGKGIIVNSNGNSLFIREIFRFPLKIRIVSNNLHTYKFPHMKFIDKYHISMDCMQFWRKFRPHLIGWWSYHEYSDEPNRMYCFIL